MSSPDAVFYFDLASPLAYLAAEQVPHVLPASVQWQPVLASELGGGTSFEAFRCDAEEQAFREDVCRRAHALGLQPLRWPSRFPFDSSLAMRVATYAHSIGRGAPFAQAAFRQAFAAGRSLAEPDNVLLAAAACELHPTAVLGAAKLRSVSDALSEATMGAARLGVSDVPAVRVSAQPASARVFIGERSLADAAAHMRNEAGGASAIGSAAGSERAPLVRAAAFPARADRAR